jgi:hypothetical protein
VAYVRKVRTTSGAVAVQVACKDSGRVVILAPLGSAHTDAELGILLEQAREIVAGGQVALDIEVAARAQSIADVPDYREPTLVPAPAAPAVVAVSPPGRTMATCSRLLYDVLGGVYDWLGFDVVADQVFRDLVIARIVEPTSKLDAARVLTDLGAKTVSYRTIQRHLDKMGPGNYRDLIAAKCLSCASDCGGLSLLLYDVTTLYFEAESEDDLRKVGFSKERRIDPQIVVGLLVDRLGFPLEVSCFDGATGETKTIIPVIQGFCARHVIAAAQREVRSASDALGVSPVNESGWLCCRTTPAM